jgi:hypothetical protein
MHACDFVIVRMEWLQVWLLVVAFLRIVGAVNGVFFLKNIKERVYSKGEKYGTSHSPPTI